MDGDDIPPLEDLTEVLENVRKAKTKPMESKKSYNKNSITPEDVCLLTSTSAPVINQVVKPDKLCGSFGGMRKGFLFGGQSKSGRISGSASHRDLEQPNDIPFITKQKQDPIRDSQFRFTDVQSAINLNEALLPYQDELLKNIEKNEKLCKQLLDPRFMGLISEFQTDPKAALEKYKDNFEIQSFFRDFCSIIGDHFTTVGDQQPTNAHTAKVNDVKCHSDIDTDIVEVSTRRYKELPSSEEDARVKEILDNPDIKSILLNPRICELMDALKNDHERAKRLLQTSDREFHSHVHKLVQVGLLQIQQ